MAIKTFTINAEKPTSLGQYSENQIIIRKIEVIEGEVIDLFSPIQVIAKLPTGETFQYYINATIFFSNTRPGKMTDLPMEIKIRYCPYTEMIIIPSTSNKKVVFRLHYSLVEGEALKIFVNQDLDGYTFSLTPSSKELIISKFKDARPVRSVFIGFDVKQSFEMMHGKLEKHIIPALTDLTNKQLVQLGEIKLIDASTNREIKSI